MLEGMPIPLLPFGRTGHQSTRVIFGAAALGRVSQDVADQALDEFFRVDGVSKWQKQSNILKMVRKQGMFRMGWDTLKALWTMK